MIVARDPMSYASQRCLVVCIIYVYTTSHVESTISSSLQASERRHLSRDFVVPNDEMNPDIKEAICEQLLLPVKI